MTERAPVPPGTYAGGGRSPIAYVFLCPPCGGYAPFTPADYWGGLSGRCGGCGSNSRELHRFPAVIDSARECACETSHDRVTGDLAASADSKLAQLCAALADVDGYIEKRAEEKAAPLVEAAAERAREMVERVEESAKAEIERLQDIAAERGKRLHEADRQREEARGLGCRLADALGWARSTPWPSLVAEIEARLKEKSDG